MTIKRVVILLLCLSIIVLRQTSTLAQLSNQIKFNKINVEHGLCNSVVYSILQDNEGLLWFATKDGVNKFDGINLTKYSLNEFSYQNASDNIVFSIAKSPTSPIYCGTASGRIYVFNKELDKFEKLNILGVNPLVSGIYKMSLDEADNLIVCSASGFFHVNVNELTINYIEKITSITQSVYKDRSGTYWVGTNDGLKFGNLELDSELNFGGSLQTHSALTNDIIFCITEDAKDRLWIGTRNNGLYISDSKKKIFRSLNKTIINQFGRMWPIRDVEITPNKVLVALDGLGICVFDNDLNIIDSYVHIDDVSESLSNNGVYDIFIDKSNTLWIATFGGGINYVNKNKESFVVISHILNNDNSVRNNTARSFLETNDGKFWFGTKKGLSILNVKTNKWKHLSLHVKENEDVIILDIYQALDGYVWVGTFKYGLIKINPNNYKFELVGIKNEKGEKIGTDFIYSIHEDKTGRIWSGGIFNTLTIYDPKTKIGENINISNIKSIYESNWGPIYIGTTKGMFEVDPITLAFERPKPYNVLLNQNRIFNIVGESINGENILWLGTEGGGLLKWNITKQQNRVYSKKDGLSSNFVYGIERDNEGYLWLSTTNGLVKLNTETDEIVTYGYSDGLSDQEFNFGAHGKTKSGALLFGGQNGFTYFHPKQLVQDSIKLEVVLNSFKLFGKELEIGTENSPLYKHINVIDEILLNHKQNSVSIGFSAIKFINPLQVKYSWMLEGFDEDWSEPSFGREAIYTNLAPGEYSFKVKAVNQQGISGTVRSTNINIEPPFSRTILAYIIYWLVLSALIALVIQYLSIRVKQKNAMEKTRFFINIAHDLRTPLTLVKAPLEQLSKSKKIDVSDKGSLKLARKNVDRLNRLVTQLMDFQKADLDKLQFRPAAYNFIEFFNDTLSSFEPLIEEKAINVTLHFPDNDFELYFDKHKIEKVIYNLISNAIKYTNKNGSITLSVLYEKDTCILKIKDTGIGIPDDQKKNIFTRYYRAANVINSQETGSGVGLMLVKKLVELHQGTISFESVENKGTVFTIELPYIKYNSEFVNNDYTEDSEDLELYKTINTTDLIEATIIDDIENEQKNKLKVLIVEDNKELLDYISGILAKSFAVLNAENGKIGLELAKEKHPDLIISDIMMPVMDGNQMCHLLKSNINTSHIPVILLTALNTLDYKIEGLKVGADAYIEKPFDISHLMAQITNLLAIRKQLKEKFAIHSEVEESMEAYNSMDAELLSKAKEIILENISNNDLSVEMLTKELCMSRPVLYRKIKALTDQSPQDFIRLIRLVEAKKLLLDKSKSIGDVAYETGFSDPKYFSTSFKKQFGFTPSQFTKGEHK